MYSVFVKTLYQWIQLYYEIGVFNIRCTCNMTFWFCVLIFLAFLHVLRGTKNFVMCLVRSEPFCDRLMAKCPLKSKYISDKNSLIYVIGVQFKAWKGSKELYNMIIIYFSIFMLFTVTKSDIPYSDPPYPSGHFRTLVAFSPLVLRVLPDFCTNYFNTLILTLRVVIRVQ